MNRSRSGSASTHHANFHSSAPSRPFELPRHARHNRRTRIDSACGFSDHCHGGRTMRAALVVLALAIAASSTFGADSSAKCAAAKRKAAGKKIGGKMTCYGKAKAAASAVDGECLGRAEAKF